MVFYRSLFPARYEDDLLYARSDDLLHYELYEGLVDDREQFFGDGFRRGQHPGTEAAGRDDRLFALSSCHAPSMFLMVSFSSRVSADFTT